jgi:O-antigen/teichoic acid export membrane protein
MTEPDRTGHQLAETPRLRRRLISVLAVYGSIGISIATSLVVLRVLGPKDAGRYTVVFAAVAFFDQLLELTSDEALIKFGFRYTAAGQWGRFHRLVRQTFLFEVTASLATGGLIAAFAFVAGSLLHGADGLRAAFLIAAVLPTLQSIESMGAAALALQGRYDVRGLLLVYSMTLRLIGLTIGAERGVTAAVVGVVAAQIVTTATVSGFGLAALSRFPQAAAEPLGGDRGPLLRFIAQSSIDTALVSLRTWIAPLMLGIVRTTTTVGLFRGAQAPQIGFQALSSPIRAILLTDQTRDWEHGRIQAVLRATRRYVAGSTLLMIVLLPPAIWAMPWLVRNLLGNAYAPASQAARLMAGAAAIQLVFGWTKTLPVTIGRPGLRPIAHAVETAVLLPLIIVFGKAWGVTGAAGAVLASTCAFAVIWTAFVVRLRQTGFHPDAPPDVGAASSSAF